MNSLTPNHLPLPIPRPSPQLFQNPLSTHPNQSSTPIPFTRSYASQVTPTYSPFYSDRSHNNSPDNIQISEELENFITLQQQLTYPHTLTIHQLSSTVTSSNPQTPTPLSDYTPSLAQSSTSTETPTTTNRAYRTFKRKFLNHPFKTKP